MSDYIVATMCACHREAHYRYRVKVGGSEVWIVVCERCLQMEREDVQHGQDPPGLEELTPRLHRRKASVSWRRIRAALSFGAMTRQQIAAATGLSDSTVGKHLTAHHGKHVQYYRCGHTTLWELCEGKEEIPY